MKGKCHVYKKDDINTDEIIPARYLNEDKEEELAKYAMEDLDKEFINKVKEGDFIVAGENFGCGSSREHAIWSLRGAGVKVVIAKSFARIFYRNAVNNGFIVIESDLVDNIKDQSELTIDLENGKLIVDDKEYDFPALPEFALNLIEKGGLIASIK